MQVLSLFDGMSCARLALDRAGFNVSRYYASEIDKYAIKVSQANYPDIIQVGDIKDIKASDLPPIDLIIGGSPCQGFSFAGKQLNFNDERSKLFFEFVRLVDECKPKYFLLENVKMVSRSQDVISEALGVGPMAINSALCSAQNRQRLYWFNWDAVPPKNAGPLLNSIIEGGSVDRKKAYCIDANYFKGTSLASYLAKKRRQIVYTNTGFRKLTPIECERLQTVPDNYTNHVSNTQRYKMLGNGFTVNVISHLLKELLRCKF